MLGRNGVVTPVVGEHQAVEEDAVSRIVDTAEQGATQAHQRFLVVLAYRLTKFLPGLTQRRLLGKLESGDALAYLDRLGGLELSRTLEFDEAGAQLLHDNAILCGQFGTEKLYDSDAKKDVERRLVVVLGVIQSLHEKIGEGGLEVEAVGGSLSLFLLGRPEDLGRHVGWCVRLVLDQVFDLAVTGEQAADVV